MKTDKEWRQECHRRRIARGMTYVKEIALVISRLLLFVGFIGGGIWGIQGLHQTVINHTQPWWLATGEGVGGVIAAVFLIVFVIGYYEGP